MNEILLKKFDELEKNGQLDNFVDVELKNIFLKSVLNGLPDMRYHVLLSDSGLSVTGALAQGCMTMEEYNDKAIMLITVAAHTEIEGTIVDLDNLEEEEKKELIEKIMLEENLENEDEVINELYRIDIDNYFSNINYSRYKELLEEYAENEWDYYHRDNLLQKIHESIAFESCLV